ncbi:hypothetical protein QNH47_00875 [Virgibacillus halodenitrificans]|uniref:hypothetical protein n=1 Tax=Virgibacillus halodenitrificans TaxID=1482 RepID=UPI0024C0886C|nr:hypothetical protein [Virgibacillus halodenitrificans]WHX26437.1 hypothetical protein QNH47_00875 [Virgibacillus halodenitrificans]
MKYNRITVILGIISIILAYFPIYSRILTLAGVFVGIVGIILSSKLPRKLEKNNVKYFRVSKGICYFGTFASLLMFLYVNTTVS